MSHPTPTAQDYLCVDAPAAEPYTLARARFVAPIEAGKPDAIICDGYVLTKDNVIAEVGAWSAETAARLAKLPDLHVVGGKRGEGADLAPMQDGLIMPGFVKGHGHDHESPIIGLAKDACLTEWLDGAVNQFTGFLNEHRAELIAEFRKSANLIVYRKAVLDDISFGITSSCTHHCNHNKYFVGDLVRANVEAGTKRIVAVGAQDRHYDPRILDTPEGVVARMDAAHAAYHGAPRTQVVPGPDQFFSNGPEVLKALKQWAREHGTVLHIHSSEEPGTTRWFRETYGQTPIEYADAIGVLDEQTVVAHQVNCTEHDLELLAERGVKVCHNPLANTILGSGMPPVPEMLARNIPVAISTDGSGSADSQNMIQAMHLTAAYYRARDCNAHLFPAAQCIEMCTAVPASYYGWNTGRLVPGMDADYIMIDLRAPNLCPSNARTVLNNVLWAAAGSEVRHVVANGIVLREDYEFKTMDKNAVCEELQHLTERFYEWLETAEEIKATGAHGN